MNKIFKYFSLLLFSIFLVSCTLPSIPSQTPEDPNYNNPSGETPVDPSKPNNPDEDPNQNYNENEDNFMNYKLVITCNGHTLIADFCDNPSAEDFYNKLLKEKSITLSMSDYGNFEKVSSLPFSVVRSDTYITTTPGDVILYLGNNITIYYDVNSWNFTRLAHIEGATREQLLNIFGNGDCEVVFSLQYLDKKVI